MKQESSRKLVLWRERVVLCDTYTQCTLIFEFEYQCWCQCTIRWHWNSYCSMQRAAAATKMQHTSAASESTQKCECEVSIYAGFGIFPKSCCTIAMHGRLFLTAAVNILFDSSGPQRVIDQELKWREEKMWPNAISLCSVISVFGFVFVLQMPLMQSPNDNWHKLWPIVYTLYCRYMFGSVSAHIFIWISV